jgi:signal transduction histidine kinase
MDSPLLAVDADSSWLATLHVLYIEDDATTRALLGQFLRRRVGRLIEACDGVEGLRLFLSERPSLVITDIRMPNLDGLQLAEEIRRSDAAVPIIIITAFDRVDYLERAIDIGVSKFVTKPVDASKLEAALLSCARQLRGQQLLDREREAEGERLRAHEREALGLLAGGMAHDFNNLLQIILFGLSYATEQLPAGSELATTLGEVLDAGQQANELGRALLMLSERWPFRLAQKPIEACLRAALSAELEHSKIVLHLALPSSPCVLPHDPEVLQRALAHLVRNAREAMQDHGDLWVEARWCDVGTGEANELRPGRYLALTVRDSGPGIAPALLPRIFDPYFSTKQRGVARGMGLGLALCRAITRKHGGGEMASSAPGEGATFTVLLPATEGGSHAGG